MLMTDIKAIYYLHFWRDLSINACILKLSVNKLFSLKTYSFGALKPE